MQGFAILDADGGTGWDLLCSLIQYEPSARLTAAAALGHPWFGAATPTGALSATAASLGKVVGSLASVDDGWLESRMSGNGTAERGGFTEAYLTEEGFTEEARKREVRAGTAGCRGPLSAAWGAARRCTDRPRLGHLPCPTYSPPPAGRAA